MSKQMPLAPKFTIALIGPGIVLIAMGLGSGEFILWPYLVAQYGFGVLWGALLGITLQYFVSNESGRYTLATGGSIYYAFSKLWKWLPLWFIVSTFASFAWPGIIGSGGVMLSHLLNIADARWITILLLIIIGLLLTFGGKVYNNLERVQKIYIGVSIPVLILIAILIFANSGVDAAGILTGLVGVSENYFLFPEGLSLISFLGAVAYSGAAGNLVLSHSFYVQDEGLGMAKYLDTQISRKSELKHVPAGKIFDNTPENISRFKKWLRLTSIEQFISFWGVGLFCIVLLTFIAYALTYPFNGEEGFLFIFLQAEQLNLLFGSLFGTTFLVIGVVFLFTTQLGIFETTTRIMTENLQLLSNRLNNRYKRSSIYFTFLWGQIIAAIAITMFGLEQPIQILLIGTFFSAVSMFALSGLVYLLNTSNQLYYEVRPSFFRRFVLLFSTIFFGIFVLVTVINL